MRDATGVTCITLACWEISEKGTSAPLRALARFKSAKKGRREQMVACAQAFGETRSTRSVVFWRIGDAESFWKNIGERGFSPFACTSTLASRKRMNDGASTNDNPT